MNTSVVDAVRDEIKKLPSELQESGLAAAAFTLAQRLEGASPRDTAGIARELRTTLAELHERASEGSIEEDDPIESLRQANPNLSSSS